MDEKIASGDFSITFGTPETIIGQDRWRSALQTDLFCQWLVGIAVCKVHTLLSGEYMYLSIFNVTVVCLFAADKRCPFSCLLEGVMANHLARI